MRRPKTSVVAAAGVLAAALSGLACIGGGAVPTLVYPSDGDTVSASELILSWTEVEGARLYRLEIDRDSFFMSPAVSEESESTTWAVRLDTATSPLAGQQTYYWHVAAYVETWGAWSETRSFYVVTPPGLISPLDADTIKFPTLRWRSYPSATSYRLYIYQGDIAAGLKVTDTLLTDTSFIITDSLGPATYRWSVNAVVEETEIPYPDTFRFVTYTLDESYFPAGPGYEWEYQKTYSSWGRFGSHNDTTFYSIDVVEFVAEDDSLYVVLSDRLFFTGDVYIYRNDSVYFNLDGHLVSISLIPSHREPMFDHKWNEERPDLWAEKDSDSTFHWGDTWGDGGEPYHEYWIRECWQKGKRMYLFYEGESYHYQTPDEEHPNGSWLSKDTLIHLNKG